MLSKIVKLSNTNKVNMFVSLNKFCATPFPTKMAYNPDQ